MPLNGACVARRTSFWPTRTQRFGRRQARSATPQRSGERGACSEVQSGARARRLHPTDDGRVKPVIDRYFDGLDSAVEALEYLQTGRARGKVVVRLGGGAPAY